MSTRVCCQGRLDPGVDGLWWGSLSHERRCFGLRRFDFVSSVAGLQSWCLSIQPSVRPPPGITLSPRTGSGRRSGSGRGRGCGFGAHCRGPSGSSPAARLSSAPRGAGPRGGRGLRQVSLLAQGHTAPRQRSHPGAPPRPLPRGHWGCPLTVLVTGPGQGATTSHGSIPGEPGGTALDHSNDQTSS